MTKRESNQSMREKDVANVLGMLRVENLSPSDSLRLELQDYIEGKKTTADLILELEGKYSAVRSVQSSSPKASDTA